MRRRARSLAPVALAVGLVLAPFGVAACGGDESHVTVAPSASGGDGAGGGGEPSDTRADGGLGDCAEILKSYGSLAATALKGKDAAAAAEKTLKGLEGKLPADLRDDLEVVANAFGAVAEKGVVLGARELTSSAFVEANKNILGYLRTDCLPG
jgi:hypothetical protein